VRPGMKVDPEVVAMSEPAAAAAAATTVSGTK
jgi:hypothetical protein